MAKKKIIILGLGMQGKAALDDIFHNCDVEQIIVADNQSDLNTIRQYSEKNVKLMNIDASDTAQLTLLMKDASLVIDALPGNFAFSVAQVAAKVGVNLVSSMYYINPLEKDLQKIQKLLEQQEQINESAKNNGITILPEFGLDPGIDLVLGAQALSEFDSVDIFNSYGTGLPVDHSAQNTLKYRFSWSVEGVMKACKRPARIIHENRDTEINGLDIFKPENRHIIELDELEMPMECYPNGNSTYYAEIYNIKNTVKSMGRYACRWPGHCDFWERIANSGFLNDEPIQVGSQKVIPIEFTTALLNSQQQFHYNESDKDMALARVDMSGTKDGKNKRVIYQLLDFRDMDTGFTAMQRTVGFTMGIGARLILNDEIPQKGVYFTNRCSI